MCKFPELEKKMDSMGRLKLIEKLMYIGNDKAMAHINLMSLHKVRFQSIQDFRDQYLAIKKVCDELELHFGRCGSDTRSVV